MTQHQCIGDNPGPCQACYERERGSCTRYILARINGRPVANMPIADTPIDAMEKAMDHGVEIEHRDAVTIRVKPRDGHASDRPYRLHMLPQGGGFRLKRMITKVTVTDESRDWSTYHEVAAPDLDSALAVLYPAEFAEYEADSAEDADIDDFATWLHNSHQIKSVEVEG